MRLKGGLGFLSHQAPSRGIKFMSHWIQLPSHERILRFDLAYGFDIRTKKLIPIHFCNVCAVAWTITCSISVWGESAVRLTNTRVFIMEILGSTFDDSVFEESRNRVSAALPTYEPKLCEPLVGITLYSTLTRNYWYHGIEMVTLYTPRFTWYFFTFTLIYSKDNCGITTVPC